MLLDFRHFEAAAALLEAGANPNSVDPMRQTPLAALAEGLGWAASRGDEGARARAAMVQLLEAGADPGLPLHHPLLLYSVALSKPCLDWLLEAHASGRRQLSPSAAVMALQAAVMHRHATAYAVLLQLVQQQREGEVLPAAAKLGTLVVAAQHGTVQQARDVLALGANPAAPEAAPACLLAHAAMHPRISSSEGLLELLLESGAQLRVEDLLKAVGAGDVHALRRLLKIGTPQVGSVVWRAGRQAGVGGGGSGSGSGGMSPAQEGSTEQHGPPACLTGLPARHAFPPTHLPACAPRLPACLQVDLGKPGVVLHLARGAGGGWDAHRGGTTLSCPVLYNLERAAFMLRRDIRPTRVGGWVGRWLAGWRAGGLGGWVVQAD